MNTGIAELDKIININFFIKNKNSNKELNKGGK